MSAYNLTLTFLLCVVSAAGCSPPNSDPSSFLSPLAIRREDGRIILGQASLAYVRVEPAQLSSDVVGVRAPGRVSFRDSAVVPVSTPIAGRVQVIHVSVGDKVQANDPIVTLLSPDAAEARAALAAAEARHHSAELSVARQVAMSKSGVGLESEKNEAEQRLKELEAELGAKRNAVTYLGVEQGPEVVLRSPMGGTVLSRRVAVDSYAEPGDEPLVEIGDPNALCVFADVFETDLSLVEPGAEAFIEVGALREPIAGKVESVGSILSSTLRRAIVRIGLSDLGSDLRPGMHARVSIKPYEKSVITLPSSAVLVKGSRYVVYVQASDGSFLAREVKVGPSMDGKVQVLSGIQPEEQVVVHGALLIDGSAGQVL